MTKELTDRVSDLITDKIKGPISNDLILAGEHQVRAKLLIQNRTFEELDIDYLAEIIAETTLQVAISQEAATLLRPLSNIL